MGARNPAKRARTSASDDAPPKPMRRRKAGKLEQLLHMPLELLLEIFQFLEPLDVLRLARLTKSFRALLMHRSTRNCWRAALDNIEDLPEPFDGMSEPQWVNLLYHPQCYYCDKTVHNVEWSFKRRICSACWEQVTVLEGSAHRCFPHTSFGSWEIIRDLASAVPAQLSDGKRMLLQDEYVKTARTYLSKSPPERVEFLAQAAIAARAIEKHARECHEWFTTELETRYEHRFDARLSRVDEISEKLISLGWAAELEFLAESGEYPSFHFHKLVWQSRPLTPRIWQNIQGPLLEMFAGVRTRRLTYERNSLLRRRKLLSLRVLKAYKRSHIPLDGLMPECPDYFEFPPVKAIIERPSEETVDEASFAQIPAVLPALITSWREHIDADIHALLRDSALSEMDTTKALRSAMTLFSCDVCMEQQWSTHNQLPNHMGVANFRALTYPGVLSHKCLTRGQPNPADRPGPIREGREMDDIVYVSDVGITRALWSCHPLRVNRFFSEVASHIVTLAAKRVGVDVSLVTSKGMDKSTLYFFCEDCATEDDEGVISGEVAKWRLAISHVMSHHLPAGKANWRIMSKKELLAASVTKLTGRGDPHIYCNKICVHCHDTALERAPASLSSVVSHIKKSHSIAKPVLNTDYFCEFGSPPDSNGIHCKVQLKLSILDELDRKRTCVK
ncbi:hypothetical protein BDZ89DRAFT_1168857 [Hymenopellis radicata]|nr:hypothetical protein BDZ89DRAFT_1168857 [Hymenopellis radicata]